MSGIEIAGIALAVFPIVIGGLNQLVAGIETIHRWKLYRVKLQEYATSLESALAWFQDTLDELLGDIVSSDEEVKLMLEEPEGAMWQRPEHETRLRARLDRSYNSYRRAIEQLIRDINAMSEKLGFDDKGAIRWSQYSSVEREMRRLKVTFSKTRYKELLDGIWQVNRDLREITHQSIALESMKRKRRSNRRISSLKLVRKHAASLYQVLMTDKSWKCTCQMKHIASLRLEARPQTTEEVVANNPEGYTFHIMLSVADETLNLVAMSQWAELKVLPSLERQALVEGLQKTSTVTCTKVQSAKRTVRFAINDTPLTEPLQDTASANTKCNRPQNFCNALYASDMMDKEIGFLVDEGSETHQHRLYRAETFTASDISARSLKEMLTNSQRRPPDECLLKRHRLQVALILASSVLQLDGSWLSSQWGIEDIFFHYKNGQIRGTDYSRPYLSWQRCCSRRSLFKEQLPSSNHIIRSDVLLALGLALIELCFGRTLADMWKSEDTDIDEWATRIRTAIRLHKCVYQEMGVDYGDVVRRCLYQPFDVREMSLDVEEVQEKVLDDIVNPLTVSLHGFNEYLQIR